MKCEWPEFHLGHLDQSLSPVLDAGTRAAEAPSHRPNNLPTRFITIIKVARVGHSGLKIDELRAFLGLRARRRGPSLRSIHYVSRRRFSSMSWPERTIEIVINLSTITVRAGPHNTTNFPSQWKLINGSYNVQFNYEFDRSSCSNNKIWSGHRKQDARRDWGYQKYARTRCRYYSCKKYKARNSSRARMPPFVVQNDSRIDQKTDFAKVRRPRCTLPSRSTEKIRLIYGRNGTCV